LAKKSRAGALVLAFPGDFYTLIRMKSTLSEYRTFFREFRETFKTTGAIAPSGRSLARATVQPLIDRDRPARILEVGAGTGAVTREIVKHIREGDLLDVVELNERFVEVLKYRFAHEPSWKRVADQSRVLHMEVQKLKPDELYDFLICGVPFNNFSIGLTREIFRHFTKLLKPGGTLTFFEYKWIRRFKGIVANSSERKRLMGVGHVLSRYLERYEFRCNTAWVNFPPAMAHHLRLVDANAEPPAAPAPPAPARSKRKKR
jgi:phospholipid N-methyltransferase